VALAVGHPQADLAAVVLIPTLRALRVIHLVPAHHKEIMVATLMQPEVEVEVVVQVRLARLEVVITAVVVAMGRL
jgi:hypothetical protein